VFIVANCGDAVVLRRQTGVVFWRKNRFYEGAALLLIAFNAVSVGVTGWIMVSPP